MDGLSGIILDKAWIPSPYIIQFCECCIILSLILFIIDLLLISPEKIKNLPCVPSPFPLLGHLTLIIPPAGDYLRSPCVLFENISHKYGEIYQIRFGKRQIVVVNSYDAIIKLWCSKNAQGNNSRPKGHTFHNVLSQSGVFTIGTTPFGSSYLKERKFVSRYLFNDSNIKIYISSIIDQVCNSMLSSDHMVTLCETTSVDVDLIKWTQYFHLKLALLLTYGYSIELNGNNEDEKKLADEIIYVENIITRMRSHVSNIEDYLPKWIRYFVSSFNKKEKTAINLFKRRSAYLDKFYQYTKKNVNNNSDSMRNCVMYNYFNPDRNELTADQIGSVCLTMVSAGLDNTALNFGYLAGQLAASPHIQNYAYKSILDCYNQDPEEAWDSCAYETKCDYISALVKETLRYFSVLPMSLPRETTRDIVYRNNIVIPKGTVLFMNSWAGNHDPKVFYKPNEFIPERYLDANGRLVTDLKHLSFGIGSRMCLGNNLAFKELYVLTCKYVLKFKFDKPTDPEMVMECDPLQLNAHPDSIAIEPKKFHVTLSLRKSR